ncbi:hypothetical protein ADUPG1_012823 [Aduncisulcus paluster]|uniref:Uncharacterized protein n=1 Tax=Aduncisulcus paluster TaxID=2918883 RepID=A0ABQ5K0S9_9EUKA|nr:hypothetical protein ADUPG1_012823 [Aduncisulcus paluster]
MQKTKEEILHSTRKSLSLLEKGDVKNALMLFSGAILTKASRKYVLEDEEINIVELFAQSITSTDDFCVELGLQLAVSFAQDFDCLPYLIEEIDITVHIKNCLSLLSGKVDNAMSSQAISSPSQLCKLITLPAWASDLAMLIYWVCQSKDVKQVLQNADANVRLSNIGKAIPPSSRLMSRAFELAIASLDSRLLSSHELSEVISPLTVRAPGTPSISSTLRDSIRASPLQLSSTLSSLLGGPQSSRKTPKSGLKVVQSGTMLHKSGFALRSEPTTPTLSAPPSTHLDADDGHQLEDTKDAGRVDPVELKEGRV